MQAAAFKHVLFLQEKLKKKKKKKIEKQGKTWHKHLTSLCR